MCSNPPVTSSKNDTHQAHLHQNAQALLRCVTKLRNLLRLMIMQRSLTRLADWVVKLRWRELPSAARLLLIQRSGWLSSAFVT